MDQSTTEAWVAMARSGCEYSRVQLLDELRPRLLRHACGYLKDSELAEDAVQETLLALMKAKYCTGEAPLWPWLVKVVTRAALQIRRQRANSKPHNRAMSFTQKNDSGDETTIEPIDSSATPEDQAIRNENIRHLRECLNSLPEDERNALIVKDIEDHTYEEAADIFDCPATTIKSRVLKARQHLVERLMRTGSYEEVRWSG